MPDALGSMTAMTILRADENKLSGPLPDALGSISWVRNAPSTARNSMTGSERPSPEPLLKKEASSAVLGGGGGEFWKCSESLKCLEL